MVSGPDAMDIHADTFDLAARRPGRRLI